MKKLILGTVAAISLITGASAIAYAAPAPSESMVRMFAQSQDMTEHQVELMVALMQSGKTLAAEVKKPKTQVRDYLTDLVEKERIDVDQVMAAYKTWQQGVDQKFEEAVRAAAELHANLSVDQRQQLVDTIKKMRRD